MSGHDTRQSQSGSRDYRGPRYGGRDQFTNYGNNQRQNQYGYQHDSLNQIEGRNYNLTNFANPRLAELEYASYRREMEEKEKRELEKRQIWLEKQRNMSKYAIRSVFIYIDLLLLNSFLPKQY